MSLALCALSHSPLYGISDPAAQTLGEVRAAFAEMRDFVASFDPEITIVFGPDHFNGVFYDMMPPFCIGTQASSVGDWGTFAGPLPVDHAAACRLVAAVLAAGVDVARSERLQVDHGIAQALELVLGRGTTLPLVPIFVNAVGLPLGPLQRVRLLGEAVGREASTWNKRVLLIASGGLSHDPPVPRLAGAAPDVAERLIDGRNPTPQARALRERRVIEAGAAHALGGGTAQPVNPAFDAEVMARFASGRLADADAWTNEWIEREGGHSGHEIRAWLAAFAALSAGGAYRVTRQWYWPVKEWMTGFAMMTAVPHG